MKVLICGPGVVTDTRLVRQAVAASEVPVSELVTYKPMTPFMLQAVEWAEAEGVATHQYSDREQAIKALGKSDRAAIIAVLGPDCPDAAETVDMAERARIPVFVYRELYRQDPRLNCRLAPISRPDVWIKGMEADHQQFFRKLWQLCREHSVEIRPSLDQCGDLLIRFEGAEYEGLEVKEKDCQVRSRGSLRSRRIRLD